MVALFVYSFTALFPIVNPIGMSGVFLTLTSHFSAKERHALAIKVSIYFFVLLAITFEVGTFVLDFFGITVGVVRVAGGLLVCQSAWEMLNAKPEKKGASQANEEEESTADVAFFPLTMPLTAGAGTIAMTIALASRVHHSWSIRSLEEHAGALLAILAVAISVLFCYRFSDAILGRLGRVGTIVVTKLSSFILLAVGVDVVWEGIVELIQHLPQ